MVTNEKSRTLILVCRRAFSRIVERVLRQGGFGHFQRGKLSLVGGAAAGPEGGEVASEVFVLVTEVSSANRLAEILRTCPIRGSETGLFELYTIDHWIVLIDGLVQKTERVLQPAQQDVERTGAELHGSRLVKE